MAEIKVQIEALEEKISQLRNLQSKINGRNTSCPPVVGGGNSINQIEAIANMYRGINVSLLSLVMSTVSFMSNVKQSYEKSDKEASDKITAV